MALFLTDPLSITDLYHVNVSLADLAYLWKEFGLALGLKPSTLRIIHLRDVKQSFTEVVAAWLNGEDRPRDSARPNWGEVITALKSINMLEEAQQLLGKLKCNGKKLSQELPNRLDKWMHCVVRWIFSQCWEPF